MCEEGAHQNQTVTTQTTAEGSGLIISKFGIRASLVRGNCWQPSHADPARLLVSLMPVIRDVVMACLYAKSRRANASDVDDLCQQTALHLIENDYARLLSYDAAKSVPRTWLRTVVRNLLAERFRRAGHADETSIEANRNGVHSPEDALLKAEEEKLFEAAFVRLGSRDRDFVDALRQFGSQLAPVCDYLGISRRDVYQRKRQLVAKLRRSIGRRIACDEKKVY